MNHWALWIVIAGFIIRTLMSFVDNVRNDKDVSDMVISIIVYLMFMIIASFAIIELAR